MATNEIINVDKIVCREFDIQEIWQFITHPQHKIYVWSWATRLPVIMKKRQCLRFRVNGRFHAGHVYIVLNAGDLFDIYYTSIHGTIKKKSIDIFIGDLMSVLDREIESGK